MKMSKPFSPSFKHFQRDIERFLIASGLREKRKDGFTAFKGYENALQTMFNHYLDAGKFDPLVAHFRNWNWEMGYNDYLLTLTSVLSERRDWLLLKRLWEGVIAKRKKAYNEVWKIEKANPGTLPGNTLMNSCERLVETLDRVRGFAQEMGRCEDVAKYAEMSDRVKSGKKA